MAEPSLFPLFMNPLGGGGTAGGGDIIVELMAEPEIFLDPEIVVVLDDADIELTLEEDIEIEVE